MGPDPLAMEPAAMRELGYRTVDLLIDELTDRTAPPLRRASPAEMRARLDGAAPEAAEPYGELLERLRTDVRAHMERPSQPGRARRHRLVQGLDRLPGDGGRLLVTGGSAANMRALACAR